MKLKRIPIVALARRALFAAGSKQKPTGTATLAAGSGGRDIRVSADGGAFVQPQEDRFIVKLTGHEIVIDREHVLMDKKEGAKVPSGAKKFDVTAGGGTLTVSADGAEILKTAIGK